ncbi:autoinducer-2 (AI-2) modifying protein LsrG [Variovorax sp. PBS-H4]|uniref:putative quinol monooxygenase n=1 Tax=Variovorax sp. PBS-H4 TaxID=434008 RepID=UPI001316D391|nr:putative quinol monooxygenase [Variovorax sp. PBS-H4]VTU22306.1 autoinducer-2 (AI-2) modifying protein LsrG [Variovorax sp. PBS-H4]
MTISLIVEFSIKTHHREDFLAVMQNHARESRKEEGCLQFKIITPSAPMDDRVFLFEEWKDQAALDWHLKHSKLGETRKQYDAWIFNRHILHGAVQPET